MRSSFEMAGISIKPGSRTVVDLPLPKLRAHSTLAMPIHVIHGKQDGPILFVSAAIHGDELNGIEIIRRLLATKVVSRLKGTMVAVPMVNAYGLMNESRYLPDRRDLNRAFPGSESGSLAARLAHLFVNEVVTQCTYGIDLHTGSNHRSNLPQIRANLEDEETERLARSFGVPVLLNSATRDGSLRAAAGDLGIPTLLYEAGEALRYNEVAIRAGTAGIISVMRSLGMLRPLKKQHKHKIDLTETENHIKQFHWDLLCYGDKDARYRGRYKTGTNSVNGFDADGQSVCVGFQTATPFDALRLMQELIDWYNATTEPRALQPLIVVVVFLKIHPFQDGNGRLRVSLSKARSAITWLCVIHRQRFEPMHHAGILGCCFSSQHYARKCVTSTSRLRASDCCTLTCPSSRLS